MKPGSKDPDVLEDLVARPQIVDEETGLPCVGESLVVAARVEHQLQAVELRADGFFITGDLGRVDEDGYVHIVGRNKDLIISGGYNIYPKEIELVLDDQHGVLESAVIGVPHADFGETVVAIIVPEAGSSPDLKAIESAAAGALARFTHPRRYILLEELPRNTMGKVQKNMLRDAYKDLFETA